MWSVPPPLCGVCDTVANPAITCSGPCAKSFHTLCVDVDTACLDAVAINPGLRWFCPVCWPEGLTLLKSGKAAEPGKERKLPPELWERVFRNLSCVHVLRVRLTCRYWRDIVDGSRKILDKQTVHFPPCVNMDLDYNPMLQHLIPAAKAVFYSAFWTKIITVDHWWPAFGQRLTHLLMGKSETTLATFVDMLRHTPNLRELEVGQLEYETTAGIDVDFQLTKMERLRIREQSSVKVLDVFQTTFPLLKSFKMNGSDIDDEEYQSVLSFMKAVQRSMEEIDLYTDDDLVIEICKLDHLKLKKVPLDNLVEDDALLEVCRLQPHLEDITIPVFRSNEVLCQIGNLCSKLRRITTSILHIEEDGAIVPSFLNTMPALEYLKLEPDGSTLVLFFKGVKNVHLTEISLSFIKPVGNSLLQYLKQSPWLTTVELSYCTLPSWLSMINTLQTLKCLENLTILRVTTEKNIPLSLTHEPFERLKRLKLAAFPNEMLEEMLSLCPVLRELILEYCGFFEARQQLTTLKKLTLRHSAQHFDGACNIVNYCRDLEELTVGEGSALDLAIFRKAFGSKLVTINC